MRLLDKYIGWEYFKTFCIITFSFTALFLAIDIFDRLPRMIRYQAEAKDAILYLVMRVPYIIVLSSPVSVLLSGLFLMSRLSKYNESIAIRSAGISIPRMALPMFVVAFLYSIFILFFGEYVLPKAEDYRSYVYNVKIKNREKKDVKMRSNIHYQGQDNHLYYIGFFDGYRNTLKVIDITHHDPQTGNILKKIIAKSAKWKDDKWVFEDCYIRTFKNGVQAYYSFHENVSLDEINATPLDFIKSAKKPLSMNYFELKEYIERLKKIGEDFKKELVELRLKISFPFANFIIVFFTIPLASTSIRTKGRGLIFVLGILLCFLYISSLRICQSLGYNAILSPTLAVWLPNIVFGGLGLYFLIKSEV